MKFKNVTEYISNQNSKLFVFTSLFILTLLSYFYALNGDFVGDDIYRIAESLELNHLMSALTGELRDRPLLMISIWLDKSLFNLNTVIMRVEDIALHSLVGLQIYLIIIDLLQYSKKEVNKFIVFLVTALFILHPLHNQTINIIIQRGVLLSSLFSLLSIRFFYFYIYHNKSKDLLASSLFFILGLLCKPNIMFLPIFYLFIYLYYFKKELKKPLLCFFVFTIPLLIPIYFYTLLNVNAQRLTLSPLTYFLVETQVIFSYFKLMVFPIGLKYLYDFHPPTNIFPNIFWLYLAGHLLIITLSYKLIKNRFFYIWFIGTYLAFIPESSFFPIMHYAFEHRTYVPMIFLFILGALLISDSKKSTQKTFSYLIVFLIFCSLGINQIRNYQIKSATNWKLHTLENSSTVHSFNFKLTIELLLEGHADKLKDVVKKFEVLYPDAPLYLILSEIYNYYIENKSIDRLRAVSKYLLEYDLPEDQREYVNAFLIKALDRSGATIEDLLFLEETLSLQQRIFHSNAKTFQAILSLYEKLADQILLNFESDQKLKNLNFIQYLKIRTILKFYYHRRDDSIKHIVQEAFLQDPNSQTLKRLAEMLHD
jgi:hypothetical protein